MKRTIGLRWHRFALEFTDQQLLRRIRDLYHQYRELMDAKSRAEPLVEFEKMNLTEFTLRVLNYGLDAMKLAIDRKTKEAIRAGAAPILVSGER